MTKAKTNSRSTTALAILLLGLCVIACNRLGRSNSEGRGSDSRGPTTTSGPPFERPLQLATPRTLKYADLQITVTKGLISNRAPDVSQADNSNPATADITLQVRNTLNDAVRIRSGLWQLRLGNGAVYKTPFEDNFEARDTQERKISFRVPLNAEWAGAQLTFDEQGKEAATLGARWERGARSIPRHVGRQWRSDNQRPGADIFHQDCEP